MISFIDGNVYIQVPPDAVDVLAVAVLKEGRELVEDSIEGTLRRIIEDGMYRPNHVEDLVDNCKYLAAFNTLLEYYGEE